MADDGQYQDQDTVMGGLLSRLLNPPPDPDRQIAQNVAPPSPAQAPRSPVPTIPANDPRFAVPAGEPPNPVLKVRPQVAPSPAVAPKPATPPAVTPSGNGPAAPKSWADYVRQSNDSSLQSLSQAQQAATDLQNEPSATAENAPLEAQRTALAQPLNPNDPNYRPGIATRIARGFYGARKGGPGGILDPSAVGATPYGAPNSRFTADTARRQAQAGVLQSEEQRNIENEKADSERLRNVGTEQSAVSTGYQDVAKDSTAQQGAEQKAEYNRDLEEVKQQLADQGGVPKTYEQAVIASKIDPDPAKRTAYAAAADQMAKQDAKKFQYANRAAGGDASDDRRQSLIDAATADVNKLNTWEYDPDANSGAGGFYDPTSPNRVYSPTEFTAMKNQISTKLDAQLTSKKMRPLGVRFNVKDTTPGSAQPQAPAQTAPSATTVPQGQAYKGYKYLGGDRTDPKNWQKVGQ
ncbi:MAG: hypothetical protein WCA44_05815 [Acidobacteriaceae bacterium]